MRVLVELRSCGQGYYGIAQETRLVFATLSRIGELELGGLLNPLHDLPAPDAQARTGHTAGGSDLQVQALLVAALERELAGNRRRGLLTKLERRLFGKGSGRSLLPRRLARQAFDLTTISTMHFGDFVWETYFARTLHAADRAAILAADFVGCKRGWLDASAALMASGLPDRLATDAWDLLICQTGWPFALPERTRLVVRYHDAIPLFLPHTLSQKSAGLDARRHAALLRFNAGQGAFFVCTSEPVRGDLLALHPELADRSTVIPDIVAPDFWPERTAWPVLATILVQRRHPGHSGRPPPAGLDAPRPYLLTVSTIEPRKNHRRLLQAWHDVCRVRDDRPLLLLVGNAGWRCETELDLIGRMTEAGEVLHLSGVPIEELRLLYGNARAVVCPSRAEGFDLSGIEAMLCAAPVIASDIPVHRTVYGDAALYVDAYDPGELARAMRQALDAEVEIARLRAAGPVQGGRYRPHAIQPQWATLMERLGSDRSDRSRR